MRERFPAERHVGTLRAVIKRHGSVAAPSRYPLAANCQTYAQSYRRLSIGRRNLRQLRHFASSKFHKWEAA